MSNFDNQVQNLLFVLDYVNWQLQYTVADNAVGLHRLSVNWAPYSFSFTVYWTDLSHDLSWHDIIYTKHKTCTKHKFVHLLTATFKY